MIWIVSQASEKKLSTDEEKFIETLTSRSNAHLIELYKEYEKVCQARLSHGTLIMILKGRMTQLERSLV